ncbi:MAG TPA: ATP-binding protein [Thermoanaerobaculia bacterium]|nr:ATP-binding protein [Thermoanaerobaculia bacterium]
MPKIQWAGLPPALRDHLFERFRDRKITVEDLYQLKTNKLPGGLGLIYARRSPKTPMPSLQQLIEGFDWASTPVGPREAWPQSLRTAVGICVASQFPILIWWGPELTMIYNDAYSVMLGDKHPRSLGAAGRQVWGEIWDVIGPLLDTVRYDRRGTWSDDQLLVMNRYGFYEETYFTFSYSPIDDESGGVGGIFTAVTETTQRVIGERRLETLRQLAANVGAKTVDDVCLNAVEILSTNPRDLPFVAIDLRDERICTKGDLTVPAKLELPLIVPGEELAGKLIAGISPLRPLDDAYRSFVTLVGGHIASAIANAKAYEIEKKRAEALAELDRAKTAFFSNISHEFRTPLTLMLGPLEDALALHDLPPAAREPLDVAHRNSLRLLKLVNTLLDFSRIEAGRVEAVYDPVDLAAYTSELASVFRSAIERAGLRLVLRLDPLGEPVYVDRDMWEKIVLNLISNALKFTFDGEIEVSLEPHEGEVTLAVRDTGTGIAPEEIPRLFERFYRVRNARSRTHEGSGIGLALVQELARLHGGSVGVTSEAGQGSTFSVTIPTGKEHLPPERIGVARALASTAGRLDAWVEEADRDIRSDEPQAHKPLAGANIVVADDNADMREYLARLLRDRYDVTTVPDGEAALAAIRERLPDLVLADVMMPRVDGLQLLKTLRQDERTRNLPVILLSARAGEEAKVEGIESGADDYLVKPFSARELLARVEGHLRLHRLRRDAEEAVRTSQAKFSTAFDRSPLALTISSLDDGRLIEVNEAFIDLSGYSREEAIGKTPIELNLWMEPEKRAERIAMLRAGVQVPETETRFRMKSGEERVCLIGAARVEIDKRPCVLSSVLDITDRKRAEQARDEFLATLSHELRTPLTSGYGWIKLLAKTRDPELLETGLNALEQSLVNQIKLIDDLLDVSRIVAGKMFVEMQPLDLKDVVEAAVEMVKPSAQAKDISLELRADALLPVDGDSARLRQVIWNLLTNAIKFTPAGGRLEVDAHVRGSSAEVVIRDTGEGIDSQFLPHVFQRFRQADSSTSRRHGGLGIGLAIVSSIVAAHQGEVRAESEGLTKGSTFTVSIPLLQQGSIRPALPPPTRPPRQRIEGARIVVVDDDAASRRIMTKALTNAGAIVRECTNARDALDTVAEWQPDVLVSDLAMPNEDGYSLIRRIREKGSGIPAVAITAYTRAEDQAKVHDAGFQRHVAKPFDPADLVQAVSELAR